MAMPCGYHLPLYIVYNEKDQRCHKEIQNVLRNEKGHHEI